MTIKMNSKIIHTYSYKMTEIYFIYIYMNIYVNKFVENSQFFFFARFTFFVKLLILILPFHIQNNNTIQDV